MSSYHGFASCCHSNATRAPIANLPNSAQLGGSPYHSPKLHPGPCNSVGIRPRTDRQTDTHTDTQTRVTTIHFAWSVTHAKCNYHYLGLVILSSLTNSIHRLEDSFFTLNVSLDDGFWAPTFGADHCHSISLTTV